MRAIVMLYLALAMFGACNYPFGMDPAPPDYLLGVSPSSKNRDVFVHYRLCRGELTRVYLIRRAAPGDPGGDRRKIIWNVTSLDAPLRGHIKVGKTTSQFKEVKPLTVEIKRGYSYTVVVAGNQGGGGLGFRIGELDEDLILTSESGSGMDIRDFDELAESSCAPYS